MMGELARCAAEHEDNHGTHTDLDRWYYIRESE